MCALFVNRKNSDWSKMFYISSKLLWKFNLKISAQFFNSDDWLVNNGFLITVLWVKCYRVLCNCADQFDNFQLTTVISIIKIKIGPVWG